MPVAGGGGGPVGTLIYVQSFLNSATTLDIIIPLSLTVADLKTTVNLTEGTPVDIMTFYFRGQLLADATVLSAAGIVEESYISSSNNLTETGLWTKEERQDFKLELASLRRAETGRASTYDKNKLPNPYNGNLSAPDDGATALVQGRPWTTGP